MFKKARESKLYEEVVRQIKVLISKGKLKPGDLLPSEEELAKSIGVSRATVREGLRILELVGMVETKRGKGTIVTASNPEIIQERLSFALNDKGKDLLYLMQIREMFEPEVAKLAALEGDTEKIKKIKNALIDMEKDINEGGTGEEGSIAFHHAIFDSIDNPILNYIMSFIIDLEKKSRYLTLHVPGRPNASLNEHKKIFTAIEQKKPEDAALLMKEHLRNTRQILEKILPKN